MLDSLFYSSMSNVLTQWSDFRVSKNLYKSYFNMQKAEKTGTSSENSKTDTRRKFTYKNTLNKDDLAKLSEGVTTAVKKIETAFEKQKDTGRIDTDKAYSAADDFVKSYNDLVSNIKKSGDKTISGKQQLISNMTTAYAKRLENVGITIGADGKLSINKDDFKTASEEDIDKIFGKSNSFTEFMGSQASYLSKYTPPETKPKSTYTNTGSVKNQQLTSGQLLDMLK